MQEIIVIHLIVQTNDKSINLLNLLNKLIDAVCHLIFMFGNKLFIIN